MTENPLGRHAQFVQGPTGVRDAIVEYMKVAIPEAIENAKLEWAEETFLPVPQAYYPYEPMSISHRTGPILGVGIAGALPSRPVDFSLAMELEVITRYSVRLYLWCYTPEVEDGLVPDDARHETLRVRDDMSTLIRSMLYTYPGMDNPDTYSIHINTIREDFSDSTPVPNASGRYIAAVVISFDVDVEERLHQAVLGYVSEQGNENPGVGLQADHLGETP